MKPKTLIFCDQDGVLADFVSAALVACGRHNVMKDTDVLNEAMDKQLGMTLSEFWQCQDADLDFWENIKPYPGAVTFYHELCKLGDVRICTSPSLHENCASHKLQWIDRYLGREARIKTIIAKDKHLLACMGRILIDDNEGKIAAWDAEAGWSFLFPRPWNKKRGMDITAAYADALHYVKTMTQ